MDKRGNLIDASKFVSMDSHLMEERQVRALANYFRTFHDADSFVSAVEKARMLSGSDQLPGAGVWNQIATEISQIETNAVLECCLKRQD